MFSYITNQRKISPEYEDILQKFVITMSEKTFEFSDANEARKVLFSKGTKALVKILPTYAMLHQHILGTQHLYFGRLDFHALFYVTVTVICNIILKII